jgi:hypothetical protein
MKRSSVVLVLIFFGIQSGPLRSQTYIEPLVGYSTTKVSGLYMGDYYQEFIVTDSRFGNLRPLLGLGLLHRFSDRIFVKLNLNFTTQTSEFYTFGFVGYDAIRFDKYSFQVVPAYSITDHLSVGLGMCFNKYDHFEIGFSRRDDWGQIGKYYDQFQMGWVGLIRYELKPVSLELRYTNSTSTPSKEDYLVKSIQSFEFQVGFPLKIANKISFRKGEPRCPKF